MALSRAVVGTLIQPNQTPTTHDTNTRIKLTIVTILSFSERLAIANLSFDVYSGIMGDIRAAWYREWVMGESHE